MIQNLGVREADHRPTKRLKFCLAEMIPQHHVVPQVDAAVYLNDQPQAVTREISEISTDRMLPSKAVAVDLPAPEAIPEAAFGQTGTSALGAGESGACAGHPEGYAWEPSQGTALAIGEGRPSPFRPTPRAAAGR